ncbi:MAG: type II toxin-antitoxin system VapC family toxin [Planctomycetota bacterium]
MKTVYIETTIPSYYFETRTAEYAQAWRGLTRKWWDEYRSRYQLVTSSLVLLELAEAPAERRRQALALLQDVPVLPRTPEVLSITKHYIASKVMPGSALGDAGHLAVASFHGIDFLLTWNCVHLANANKSRHIQVENNRLGLSVPILTTPALLVPEDS